MTPKKLVLATVALLLLIFFGASHFYKRHQAQEAVRLASVHSAHLMRADAPMLGADNPKVVIVEFFDPACATCQAFYAPVKHLLDEYPGKIKLVLRWAPFQVGSEHIVALLEAAGLQGKLWPVLDALMETQDAWKPQHEAVLELAWQHLDGLGLDLDRLRRDMADPEVVRRLAQDHAAVEHLQIDTTPTFYVNGQPLPGFGFGVLKQAVEVAQNAP
jgi:protein-disulfide isomerase